MSFGIRLSFPNSVELWEFDAISSFHGLTYIDIIFLDVIFSLTFNYNFLAPPLLDAEVLEDFEEKKKVWIAFVRKSFI